MNSDISPEITSIQRDKGELLIVDDVPENLQVLFALLTAEGYEVRRVRSGRQALQVVSVDPPDLILLDIRMPDLNGYQVCERLKANPETAMIPVIFLSALEDVLDKVKAFSLGAVDYISKPFKAEEVLARVQNQLTIQKQQHELIAARQTAELASRVKGDFLANMSHEVRTPLTAIIGFSQILQMTPLQPEQAEFVEIIQRNGQELLALLDDILEFSKLEADQYSLKTEEFTIKEIITTLDNTFVLQCKEKGIDLMLEPFFDLDAILFGPKTRLQQVLKNLLQNAIKFTQTGYVRLVIKRQGSVSPAGNLPMYFGVEDTGCGISAEDQTKIFAPFTQADTSSTRNYGGVGLGLTICQKILRRMGSELHLQSQLHQGATFWFVVPLQMAQAADAANLVSKSRPHCSEPLAVRLLLAEDEPDNQQALTIMLRQLGYQADIAVNGQEAWSKLTQQSYDIVLMDCQMPEMDGYEATRKLRQWEAEGQQQLGFFSRVVIGITAHAISGDREKCLAAGMDDYLSKPITLDRLQKTLNRWVQVLSRRSA